MSALLYQTFVDAQRTKAPPNTAPPKEPARYATKLMSFLFTEEEMIGGLIGPIERKTTKTELDPDRLQILRSK